MEDLGNLVVAAGDSSLKGGCVFNHSPLFVANVTFLSQKSSVTKTALKFHYPLNVFKKMIAQFKNRSETN